jgi:hypothetical protein
MTIPNKKQKNFRDMHRTYQVYYQISVSTLHKDFKVEIHDQQ